MSLSDLYTYSSQETPFPVPASYENTERSQVREVSSGVEREGKIYLLSLEQTANPAWCKPRQQHSLPGCLFYWVSLGAHINEVQPYQLLATNLLSISCGFLHEKTKNTIQRKSKIVSEQLNI